MVDCRRPKSHAKLLRHGERSAAAALPELLSPRVEQPVQSRGGRGDIEGGHGRALLADRSIRLTHICRLVPVGHRRHHREDQGEKLRQVISATKHRVN